MYASHDSFTGYRPRKWYLYLLQPFSKTQQLPIDKQIECGVRVFDLRVRIGKNGNLIAAHGFSEYKVDVLREVDVIESAGCYYRVILENVLGHRKTSAGDLETLRKLFLSPNHKGCRYVAEKKKWQGVYNPYCAEKFGIAENCHKDFRNYYFLPIPRLFVRRKKYMRNKFRHSLNQDNDVHYYDFVDIKM